MSITTADDRATSYNPVTPTTMFAADFPVFDNDDLAVLVDQVEREDFTVVASYIDGVSNDATIVFASGVSGAVKVYGRRAARRSSRFTNGAPLPTKDINLAIDVLTAQSQETDREIGRAHKAPLGELGGVFTVADIENAQSYAESALNDRLLAQKWAENNRDVAVEPGKFSAKHWAEVALESVLSGVAGVSSFNGRIGAVVPGSSDYISTQIAYGASNVGAALDDLNERVVLADQPTAEAGSDDSKLMTPLTTRQAVAAYNRWETIQLVDMAGLSSVVLSNLSDFHMLRLSGDFRPQVNGGNLILHYSQDNGATFITGAEYYRLFGGSVSTTPTAFNGAGSTLNSKELCFATSAVFGSTFQHLFSNFDQATIKYGTGSIAYADASGNVHGYTVSQGASGLTARNPMNALRLLVSNGGVAAAAGLIHIEGVRG